jgi:hypothetical protein
VGVQHAAGRWLLFTDADTRHEQGSLRGVVERAETENLDLISLSPPQEMKTWWEHAVIPQIYQLLARLYPFARVNDPSDPLAAANGQFILIRRGMYERIGGHYAVRGEILEDVELARRAKQAGRIWFGGGEGIVRTRMYRTFSAMWEGWTKNLFFLYGRDQGALRRAAADLTLHYWLPPIAGWLLLAAGAPLAWLGIALLVMSGVAHIQYARNLMLPSRLFTTITLIPGSFLFFLLLLNSTRRYSRNLGVHWKGRRYPTAGRP